MKNPSLKNLLVLFLLTVLVNHSQAQLFFRGGKQDGVFYQKIISDQSSKLRDPWEVVLGPDDSLWITEAKGYKINKIKADGSGRLRQILNLTPNQTAQNQTAPAADRIASFPNTGISPNDTNWCRTYYSSSYGGSAPGPQGGMMGLAIHPEYMSNPLKKFVFVAYVQRFISSGGAAGDVFKTRIVRWTYLNGWLQSPLMVCDSIPGSSDHNSGRMIIAQQNGVNYLYYACGDMGAGQFQGANRTNYAQDSNRYEGKILRFNVDPDGDAGQYNRWIPNTNPFNAALGKQSAVWATGIRNNQGFAFANIKGADKLYGSSHGPYSDDEINVLEQNKNYGHPLVVGYKSDNNYANCSIGVPTSAAAAAPIIINEATNAANIGVNYRDPLFSAYDAPNGNTATLRTIKNMWNNNSGSHYVDDPWPSEALTGMDIYTDSKIPGYKYSLIVASLKWGRLLHLRLNSSGTGLLQQAGVDTSALLQSQNRYRDVTMDPDGRSFYVSMDSNQTSSGPSEGSTTIPGCRGCIYKYTFVGYQDSTVSSIRYSTIPSWIPIATGINNVCEAANTVTINASNNNTNYWVPITDTNSNIIAEIYANGNDLGNVTTSIFKRTGSLREESHKALYLNKEITITPQTQPSSPVSIRLYLTSADFTPIVGAVNSVGAASGVTGISNLAIFKNNDAVCNNILSATAPQQSTNAVKYAFGTSGYVLGANITSFSSFYFAPASFTTLPLNLLSFTGALQNGISHLDWKTSQEVNVKEFIVERSIDGQNYISIGTVKATGSNTSVNTYSYDDKSSTLLGGTVYYRLKIKDTDGSSKYSSVVTIEVPYTAGKVTVAPNPATSLINVKIAAPVDGPAQLQISDNTGRVVMQNNLILRKGVTGMQINLSSFTPGIYYLTVKGAQLDQKVKVQKL